MEKRFVIVGLRAIALPVLGQHIPGYLGVATEHHREGFVLTGTKGWHAWYPDVFSGNHMLATKGELPVLQFDNEQDAYNYAELLLRDNGRFRPVAILPIYL